MCWFKKKSNIVLSNLTLTPVHPLPGETVTISVTATNKGNLTGSLPITFDMVKK